MQATLVGHACGLAQGEVTGLPTILTAPRRCGSLLALRTRTEERGSRWLAHKADTGHPQSQHLSLWLRPTCSLELLAYLWGFCSPPQQLAGLGTLFSLLLANKILSLLL